MNQNHPDFLVIYGVSVTVTLTCVVSLHHDDVILQVNQQYLVNLYVDDLPIYGPLGEIKKDENGLKELKIFVCQKWASIFRLFFFSREIS